MKLWRAGMRTIVNARKDAMFTGQKIMDWMDCAFEEVVVVVGVREVGDVLVG